jgi:hypothetical protein
MIHNKDALVFLNEPDSRFRTIFADIPDNIGLNYVGFTDIKCNYINWVRDLIEICMARSEIFWLSYNQIWDLPIKSVIFDLNKGERGTSKLVQQVIWRFTFGQYQDTGLACGYRPIILMRNALTKMNYDAIRIESARQKLGDKRAAGPRVPDDVWEFPRVVGNAHERRDWHPTQHPEKLLERILLLSNTNYVKTASMGLTEDCLKLSPLGIVCDPFLGSGTTAIVAKRLGITWTGCEISPFYCKMIESVL